MPDTRKPTLLTPESLFTLPGALLISVVLLAGAVGIGWANLKTQVDEVPALKARVDDHDKALNKIEVMANDIGWIKREMESQRQRANAYRP